MFSLVQRSVDSVEGVVYGADKPYDIINRPTGVYYFVHPIHISEDRLNDRDTSLNIMTSMEDSL